MTNDLSSCPLCGNDHLYQLGDGRYKCSACRRKFSPSRRRTRLSTEAMDAIVSGFAEGEPASTVATSSGTNLKTVQLYYGRIRELLATEREQHLAKSYGSAEVPAQIFIDSGLDQKWRKAVFIGCLIDQENEMELLFTSERDDGTFAKVDEKRVSGWLVAIDSRAMEETDIDRIICLPGLSTRERARIFWTNAKDRLAAYCGGFKKNFRLYLREMEFRNNMESSAKAREHIGELLDRNSLTHKGEEDA